MTICRAAVVLAAAMYFTAGAAFSGGDRPVERADAAKAESPALPGASLYQLPVTLTTAAGLSMKLSTLRHKPLIVTLFYSQCTSVCPLLTAQLQRITRRLSATERRRVEVLMVSFDSVRDTPETLAAFASEHHIAGDSWVVARASASDVRLLAAALGIQYRELPDHTFNHSTIISVTDGEGVVQAQTSDLADSTGSFVTSIRRQLAAAP